MRLAIGMKVILSFLLILAMIAFSSYYTNQELRSLQKLQDEGAKRASDQSLVMGAKNIYGRVYTVIADAVINRDMESSQKDWNEIKAKSIKELEEIKSRMDTEDEKKNVDLARAAFDEAAALFEQKMMPVLLATKEMTEEIKVLDGKIDETFAKMDVPLEAVYVSIEKEAKDADAEFDTGINQTIKMMTIVFIAMLGFMIVLGFYFNFNIANILKFMQAEAQKLMNAVNNGKLDIRGDAEKTNFEFRGLIKGMNDIMDAFVKPLNVTAEYVDRISKGDMPPKITDEYKGDFNEIKNNLNQCIDAVTKLITDANALAVSATAGKLGDRADATKHNGDFKKIIKGFNGTLDAIIGPLNVAAEYVDRISKGDIPPKITDNYSGDFNEIKNNLNQCIDAVENLVKDAVDLAKAGVEGELDKRADAAKHDGDFKKIVKGVNDTLDAVIKPVQEAVKCLAQLAEGNLAVEMSGEYKGEHAVLKNSLNATINSMNEILGHVSISVDQVNTGARQVSDASQSLSQGATETASSLEEISSSMQEINSQIEKTAANSMEANNLAGAVRTSAESGSGKMNQMMTAMNEINEASSNISKIIKAIDEIAFQTNLLALNAAVEAARAGKHGKGFTVVAEEVRNLAQRSAKAAKETADMIENSKKKAEDGTKIADETARSLNEIVTGVARVGDIIGEIAAASKEEALGIQQINQGLGQVDQVTQQNTATAEEAAAASEELSAQAVELKSMLEKFRLRDQTGKSTVNAYLKGPQPVKNQRTTITIKQIQPPQASGKKPDNKPGNIKRSPGSGGNTGKVNPEDIISLDDHEFGKF